MTEKYYAFSCMRSVYIIDDIISETDHFIISKHHGRMKKITNDSAILDTFEDAKQWLIDHETGELKKTLDEAARLQKSISHLKEIECATGRY